jgi:hypothetical protein
MIEQERGILPSTEWFGELELMSSEMLNIFQSQSTSSQWREEVFDASKPLVLPQEYLHPNEMLDSFRISIVSLLAMVRF